MKKKTKIIIISSVAGFVVTLGLVAAIPFTILGIKTSNLNANYSYLKEDAQYKEKVEITGLELVKQHVSCGYASIQMISTYYGSPVTEDDLDARNGAVSTASTDGFLKEIKTRSIASRLIGFIEFFLYSFLWKHELILIYQWILLFL